MLYEINQDALVWEFEHLGVYKPAVAIMLEKGRIILYRQQHRPEGGEIQREELPHRR